MKSEMDMLINEIKSNCNMASASKADELRVMTSMLNDKKFALSIYDKNMGYIGQKNPHEDAEKFISDVLVRATGLDRSDSNHLASEFEFTKKDAAFFLDNMKDFLNVYLNTGRRLNIMQTRFTEAALYMKEVESKVITIPDKNTKSTKEVKTPTYIKLYCPCKSPKYNKEYGPIGKRKPKNEEDEE